MLPGSIGAPALRPESVTSAALSPGAVTLEKLNLTGSVEGQAIVRRGSGVEWESLAFWSLLGNGGTTPGTHFLGTTDNQPFEVRVNNQRALLITPGALGPNIIAGAADNQVTAGRALATIGGGGGNRGGGNAGTVAGGQGNDAAGLVATIGGGFGNAAAGARATVGGGSGNAAAGSFATT